MATHGATPNIPQRQQEQLRLHGSAPDIYGNGIATPIGQIRPSRECPASGGVRSAYTRPH